MRCSGLRTTTTSTFPSFDAGELVQSDVDDPIDPTEEYVVSMDAKKIG